MQCKRLLRIQKLPVRLESHIVMIYDFSSFFHRHEQLCFLIELMPHPLPKGMEQGVGLSAAGPQWPLCKYRRWRKK